MQGKGGMQATNTISIFSAADDTASIAPSERRSVGCLFWRRLDWRLILAGRDASKRRSIRRR